MQSYAEGFDIMRGAASKDVAEDQRYQLNLADVSEVWRRGSVVSSWLLDLTAMALDHQTVDVAWKDNSSVEDAYELQRATAQAGPYDVIATLPANTVSYHNTGLTTNTTYWYRVRATKDAGFGDFSNVASATPFLAPPKHKKKN